MTAALSIDYPRGRRARTRSGAAPFDWTVQAIAQLRQLWLEGWSTAEIGRRMRITKNSVISKAHNQKLPPRPSPIRNPRRVWTPEQDARLTELRAQGVPFWNCGETLGLSRQACQERWKVIAPAAAPAEPPQPVAASVAVVAAQEQPEPVPGATGRGGYQFPTGPDTGKPGRHLPFCGRPTWRGAYCASHARICVTAYAPRPV